MNTVNLMPTDSHKSFYGKARVMRSDDGTITLISYTTQVCRINPDGKFEKLWYGYSATTMRHIQSFCDTFGLESGGQRWWEEL